jgi:Uma2 family endonuclease
MNAHAPASAAKRLMTTIEFLAWAEAEGEGRYELYQGEIIAMAPERLGHARSKLRVVNALAAAIQTAGLDCEAVIDGIGVAIDDDTTYVPDTIVNCGPPMPPDAMLATNPVIVVEVLSPSTRNLDKSIKLADYFRLPGLHHYLIVDLKKRHILHYQRQPDGSVLVRIIKDGEIKLDPPGITIAVAALFG